MTRYWRDKPRRRIRTPHQPVAEQHRFIPHLTLPFLLYLPHMAVAAQSDLGLHLTVESVLALETVKIRTHNAHIFFATVFRAITTCALVVATTIEHSCQTVQRSGSTSIQGG
jgi:hypothetical protein